MLANTLTLDDEDAVQEELVSLQRELVGTLSLHKCIGLILSETRCQNRSRNLCLAYPTLQAKPQFLLCQPKVRTKHYSHGTNLRTYQRKRFLGIANWSQYPHNYVLLF
jgi:hypothetical protein